MRVGELRSWFVMLLTMLCNAFNTWFSSCCSSLDEVREAEHLENAIKEDEVVYHARMLVVLMVQAHR